MTATATTDRNLYGAMEINGLVNAEDYHTERVGQTRMNLAAFAKAGGHITRLRVFTERLAPGAYIFDVSYCHGELADGTLVDVINGPLGEVSHRKGLKTILVNWAKSEGVYAKSVGLLDESVLSTLS